MGSPPSRTPYNAGDVLTHVDGCPVNNMTAAQIAPLVVGEVRAAQSSKEDSGHALHPLCRAATVREASVSVVSTLHRVGFVTSYPGLAPSDRAVAR